MTTMPTDVTAILVPTGQWAESEVPNIVRGLFEENVLLRVAPLESVGLTQIEVCDAGDGLPCEAPRLVAALSEKGRATFLHVNHGAKQAIAHTFERGEEKEQGFAGEPGERLEKELKLRLGAGLQALVEADDGTRLGIGVAASRTTVLRGRETLTIPIGAPTSLNSFAFHDSGRDLERGLRMALFAYRAPTVAAVLKNVSCAELAQKIADTPAGLFGPLEELREEVAAQLRAVGSTLLSDMDSRLRIRAHELVVFGEALVFACGESIAYWDERLLPVFSLSEGKPVIDADDLVELDACPSIVDAMIEVLPYAAPPGGEGSLVAFISDESLKPLVHLQPSWASSGEYEGAIFGLVYSELLARVRTLDGRKLSEMIGRFERAWYEAARAAPPEGEDFEQFRRQLAERGQADVQRFFGSWAALRTLLEIAEANQLEVGMVFYG